MTTLKILKAARAKIATPERWTKGANTRGPNGRPSVPYDEASCFCAVGAIVAVCPPGGRDDAERAIARALGFGGRFIHHWNDAPSTTHADVLAAFDRAIATLEAA